MRIFMNIIYKGFALLVFLNAGMISSCKKFVEVPLPTSQVTSDFVFSNDQASIQAITGIYSKMMEDPQRFTAGYTTFFAGMAADELLYYTNSMRDEFEENQISQNNHDNLDFWFWRPCFSYIYAANKCIEGATASQTLTPSIKKQVIGEAKFIRAFCYFYLVNLFGDVPLVISTDYRINQSLPRNSIDNIYVQIVTDLRDAKDLLPLNYPAVERSRPNKLTAASLLARVYLYQKEWIKAEIESSEVINSPLYNVEANINNVFTVNSNETIWQLVPVEPGRNTYEGFIIIPFSSNTTPTYFLTNHLINDFESSDQRKSVWTASRSFNSQVLFYPSKYKVRSGATLLEYYVVLRLGEQYLIRAEARAKQNDIIGSQSDLNVIRNRAGLLNTTSNDQVTLLSAIEHERRTELFAEWGHRWFDLKRSNRADFVLGTLKPLTWQTTDALWPIPQNQINLNPNLTQNAGY